ncbi:DNA polymerase II [Gayadomonas joobiniege]|uniref:DNA polymerase II n=1 Tax=Gayadomonas joobiniege TaxID=1234606 RepID=UPI00037827F7|nr:DNA polymerase II [Gayadomonas joobiniege]
MHAFLLTRDSFDCPQRGLCIEYWFNSEQGQQQLILTQQQSYFFIQQQSLQKALEQLADLKNSLSYRSIEHLDFAQKPMVILYFKQLKIHQLAVKRLQSADIECFEYDIRPHDRYLIDRRLYGSVWLDHTNQQKPLQRLKKPWQPTLKVTSFDLECSEKGVLYSAAFYSPDYQKVFMRGPAPAGTMPDYLEFVEDEASLIKAIIAFIQSYDPDVIIGWNVIGFDFNLFQKRCDKHQIPMNIGRNGRRGRWFKRNQQNEQKSIKLAGRVIIDGIEALKNATYQFASFSLENVSQTLLGRGKLADDVSNRMAEINHNFAHDKLALASYNLQDCELVYQIFAKTKLLDYLILRSQLTGLEIDRNGGSVAAFTNLYLPFVHQQKYIAPNLPADGGLASPGGYVMNSQPGLYKNVLVLDFKSLYPSIIRTFKIDPVGLIEGLKAPEDAIDGFKNAKFSRQTHFLPQMIDSLWQQRDVAKAEKNQALSQAIKIIMNSFYGVLGSGGCRFYDTRLASSITLRGHQIMQQTASWIQEAGYQVIYGDTDSTFVWLNKDELNASDAQAIGRELEKMINLKWQNTLATDFNLDCFLELEFETHFKRFLMPTIRGQESGSKKRYAGLAADMQHQQADKLIFKGLETVRSDWTELAREFQTRLYEMVFNDQDPRDYVLQTVEQTYAGKYDSALIYRKRLRRKLADYQKNIPPQVRAARLADEKNKSLGRSLKYQNRAWIRYLITTVGPQPLEYLSNPIDYQHYVDKQLKPVADAILPFINTSFEEICSPQLKLF